jgi:hypothetical protein
MKRIIKDIWFPVMFVMMAFCGSVFGQQSYHSPETPYITFREVMNSEFSIRDNGGTPSNITISSGESVFNGTSSKITYPTKHGVQSVRIRLNPTTTTEDVIKLSSTHSIEIGSGTVTATGWSSPTIYVDGTAGTSITAASSEIIVTTATAFNADDIQVGYVSSYYDGTIDLIEFFNIALSADETYNLSQDLRYSPPTLTPLLHVTAQSGITTCLQGKTLTKTAITEVRSGSLWVTNFNGSSSVIESTFSGSVKSVSFWIYTDDLTQSIMDLDGNAITVSGGTITAAWADNIYVNGTAGTTITANNWNHVYLTDAGTSITSISIGKEGANYFKGQLSDIVVDDDLNTVYQISSKWSSGKQKYRQ